MLSPRDQLLYMSQQQFFHGLRYQNLSRGFY
jgi:hypothetical protein